MTLVCGTAVRLVGLVTLNAFVFFSKACSFLYLLMRSNFEFSGGHGCDRVHWQVSDLLSSVFVSSCLLVEVWLMNHLVSKTFLAHIDQNELVSLSLCLEADKQPKVTDISTWWAGFHERDISCFFLCCLYLASIYSGRIWRFRVIKCRWGFFVVFFVVGVTLSPFSSPLVSRRWNTGKMADACPVCLYKLCINKTSSRGITFICAPFFC